MKSAYKNKIITHTRRNFIHDLTISSLGTMCLGTFLQSCADKGITPASSTAIAYIEGVLAIIEKIKEKELPQITKAATLAVQARLRGNKLYSYISGDMLPAETDNSRPGSPHIFLTDSIQKASRDDVVITNVPEAARGLGERYVKVIGITPPLVSNDKTPPGVFENMGTLRIEDVSDIVIYTHVPYTDGILNVEGIDIPICPASGIIQSLVYYALAAEIVEGLTNNGIYPQIG